MTHIELVTELEDIATNALSTFFRRPTDEVVERVTDGTYLLGYGACLESLKKILKKGMDGEELSKEINFLKKDLFNIANGEYLEEEG